MSRYESCPGCWSWMDLVCLSVLSGLSWVGCLSGSVKRCPGLEGCAPTSGGCVNINEVWSERGW